MSQEEKQVPRIKKVGEKRPVPSKILNLSFPDQGTVRFWKMTADDPHEVVNRIARFSRALGRKSVTNAAQSGRRWLDSASAPRSRRSRALGRVLVMPMHRDSSSPSSPQFGLPQSADAFLDGSSWRSPISCKTEELTQGGDVKAPGVQAGKRGKRLKRGAATQIMAYPRPKTKAVLVQAARDVNRPLSSFVLMSALTQAAALR